VKPPRYDVERLFHYEEVMSASSLRVAVGSFRTRTLSYYFNEEGELSWSSDSNLILPTRPYKRIEDLRQSIVKLLLAASDAQSKVDRRDSLDEESVHNMHMTIRSYNGDPCALIAHETREKDIRNLSLRYDFNLDFFVSKAIDESTILMVPGPLDLGTLISNEGWMGIVVTGCTMLPRVEIRPSTFWTRLLR